MGSTNTSPLFKIYSGEIYGTNFVQKVGDLECQQEENWSAHWMEDEKDFGCKRCLTNDFICDEAHQNIIEDHDEKAKREKVANNLVAFVISTIFTNANVDEEGEESNEGKETEKGRLCCLVFY